MTLRQLALRVARILPDRLYIRIQYHSTLGVWPNLKDPKTFNEKLQWLKLYNRNSNYVALVDKYLVKDIIAKKIGPQYVVPTYGVWDRVEDINFNELPDRFVMKCTHDSGSVVICKSKKDFDIQKAQKKLSAALKNNAYWYSREWPYKHIKPRIIAEAYLEDDSSPDLRDYKFFCFDGVVRALFIATDRQKAGEETKFDFFDADGNHLDVRHGHPNADPIPALPSNFEKMKQLASMLSKGIPHVRVDFYECNGQIYFGELTFFHHGGVVPFNPPKYDLLFGSWITLPQKNRNSALEKGGVL